MENKTDCVLFQTWWIGPGKVCIAAELAERIAVVTHHSQCFIASNTLLKQIFALSQGNLFHRFQMCSRLGLHILGVDEPALNTSVVVSQDLNADKNGDKLDQLVSQLYYRRIECALSKINEDPQVLVGIHLLQWLAMKVYFRY